MRIAGKVAGGDKRFSATILGSVSARPSMSLSSVWYRKGTPGTPTEMAADSTPGVARSVSRMRSVNWRKFFQVAGFAVVHAELEGENVGGVKAGTDAAELLESCGEAGRHRRAG